VSPSVQTIRSYERNKLWLSILGAALSAFATVLVYYAFLRPSHAVEESKIFVQIVDAISSSPVSTSRVELESGNGTQSVTADSNGRVMFIIPSRQLGTVATVRAQAAGFASLNREIVLGKDELVVLIPIKNTSSDPAPALAPYTQVFRSGARPSGAGSDFSAWYELAAEPPRPGFVIDQKISSFVLIGDRTCNGWSQCVPSQQSDTALVWRFRMQGHNENRSNQGIGFSEAILKVTYVPKEP
jgi:hypothetical protein